MNSEQKYPSPPGIAPAHTGADYSEIYRNHEIKQLNKRLRKTRNVILLCALIILAGGFLFWIMPDANFSTKQLVVYGSVAGLFIVMAPLSKLSPYKFLLFILCLSIVLWAIEIMSGNADTIIVEGGIHKLLIISLIISSLHASKEAELIKKELYFS